MGILFRALGDPYHMSLASGVVNNPAIDSLVQHIWKIGLKWISYEEIIKIESTQIDNALPKHLIKLKGLERIWEVGRVEASFSKKCSPVVTLTRSLAPRETLEMNEII